MARFSERNREGGATKSGFHVAGKSSTSGDIAERYATALFELAEETGTLDTIESDLTALGAMIDESADLAKFIRSPLYSREEHTRALEAILKKSGANELTQQFIGTVAQHRRLFVLPDMITSFKQMLAKKRGQMSAKVESAHPLSEAQLDHIKQVLKGQLGSDVALETSVDPELLGGLVVRVGSRMIDSSIRTKLNRLQLNLKEAS
jgi:F-type H+-transporting ATPase subunit delta